MHDHKISEYFS